MRKRSLAIAGLLTITIAAPTRSQEDAESEPAPPADQAASAADGPAPPPAGEIRGRVILTDPTKRTERTAATMSVATDTGSRETLARVTLFDGLSGEVLGETWTEPDGMFGFHELEPLRKYAVRAARSGYRDADAETIVALDGVTELALRLPAKKNIWWYFRSGGRLMFLLLFISVLALYVAIERGYVLLVRTRTDAGALVAAVRDACLRRDFDAARRACDEHDGPVARLLGAGLERREASRAELEKTLERTGLEQAARLERGLAVLASASSIAPIVGFLGTVVGMIMAFDAIAEHGLSDPSYVADGISTALISTAGGLTVAVFALPAYHFLQTRVARATRQMETAANLLLETFEQLKQ